MKLDFIVIGASRSGTTWIHDNLICHPQVFLPKKVNEPTFFTKYYNRGMEHYAELFDSVKNEKSIGEITPDYLYSKKAAQRIKKHFPNVKIIIILRNPWERLYSMYWMLKGKKINGFDKISFKEAYSTNQEFLQKGNYITHINEYLNIFNSNQFLFLSFNELKTDPNKLLERIYKFIGVSDSFQAPFTKTKINTSKFHGSNGRSKLLLIVWKICQRLKLKKIAFKIEKINSIDQPKISDNDKEELIRLYKEYNLKLEKVVSFNISDWNKLS